MQQPIKLRWVIAHEPIHLFLRTAEAFKKEVESLTENRVEIEILTAADYTKKYNRQIDTYRDIFSAMEDGAVEMSQTQVHHFTKYNRNYQALDLPFLFRDHDHATSVLEGKIGQALCKNLANSSPMQGLAFTYSGGYRVIGSNHPIMSYEQLKGLRVRVNGNPVNTDFMAENGLDPKLVQGGYGYDLIDSGDLDAAETTYLRFQGKHILKTNHSLFLTTIVINKQVWASLGDELRSLLEQAAVKAARIEREWGIQDAAEFEQNCRENGVEITELSAEDQARLESAKAAVYAKWEDYFTPGLVRGILAH